MQGATKRKSNKCEFYKRILIWWLLYKYIIWAQRIHTAAVFGWTRTTDWCFASFPTPALSAEVTVVEHKVTKEQLALRESNAF